MRLVFNFCLFLLSLMISCYVFAESGHPGYISDVKKEKHLKVVEFVLPPKVEDTSVNLNKLIFTEDFSKDMINRYHRRFGYTEVQINFTTPNRFEEFTSFDGTRVTIEEDVRRKRKFAEYMLRKLTEYHVDHYLKSNKKTKKLYDIKETISNTQVGLVGGFKLRAKYSFSGKTIKLKLKNPYGIWNELIIDLDPVETVSDDETEVQEPDSVNYIAGLGFPIFWGVDMKNYYNLNKEDITTVFVKPFTNTFSMSLTNIYSFDKFNEENQIILGVDWRY